MRGYLTAVHNGYAPTQRPALEFIADRLYNNARPLYGEPNTNWVRVIYSARTVASRMPVIMHSMEENVTHDAPRPNFDTPYAEFLKIHYKGVTTMPGDEADGCEPDVSPFEIAAQSWETFDLVYRQTHDAQWLAERDNVEHLALAREPENMIDLNWKIQLLATVDRTKYAAQIDKLIDQLYSYEIPRGGVAVSCLTSRPSPRISFPIMPSMRWRWPDGAPRPMSAWRARCMPCWRRSGRKAVGKATPSIRALTLPSGPRNLP